MYVSMYVYMLIMYNMEGVSFLIIDEHIIDNANVCVCVRVSVSPHRIIHETANQHLKNAEL